MFIAAHWKVFDRHGNEIDLIERELAEIVGSKVQRTETVNYEGTYDAIFIVKGDLDVAALTDVCDFMHDAGAYPV